MEDTAHLYLVARSQLFVADIGGTTPASTPEHAVIFIIRCAHDELA
jgi:hypothetical protein